MSSERKNILPFCIFIACTALVPLSCTNGSNELSASGTIDAVSVIVSARVSGEVKTVYMEEGSRIKKGSILAVIENKSLTYRLKQAETAVALSETRLALVSKGARFEDIEQAENAVITTKKNLAVAEDDMKRMRALFGTGSVTSKQKEDAEARAVIAKAHHDSAIQALTKVKNLSRPEEIRLALLERDSARLSRDAAKDDEDHLTISSPIDGILTHRLIEEGELVFPGSRLFSITNLSEVTLTIYVSESDLARIFIGQEAAIAIDAYPDKRIPGRVIYISPEAEFTPKNVQTHDDRVKLVFAVKIAIPNPDEILKPGSPADAYLTIKNGE